jgi:3-oxoacyl-[acyl-carrier-protein] synthase-3
MLPESLNMISSSNASIRGVAVCVPSGVDKILSHEPKWGMDRIKKFTRMTGVSERRLASVTSSDFLITSSDLCFQAATHLLSSLEVKADTIDALVFVTQYPDYGGSPATACVLQHRLGMRNDVLAFDVNQGCTGYIYGMFIASSLLAMANINRVLMLCGDANHKVNVNDQSQILLFGDAGSATLLEDSAAGTKQMYHIETLGDGFRSLIIPAGGSRHRDVERSVVDYGDNIERSLYDAHMDGIDVFNFTIKEVPRVVRQCLEESGNDVSTIDYFVFHQANRFIIEQISKKLGIPKDKILYSLDCYGNTSCAPIPTTLCHNHLDIDPLNSKRILLCGFGVGLSLGVSILESENIKFLPITALDNGWNDELI